MLSRRQMICASATAASAAALPAIPAPKPSIAARIGGDYTSGVGTWAEADSTAFARSLVAGADAAAARTTLGVSVDTKGALEAASIAATVDAMNVLGYTSAGDGGGGIYKRVASEPSHAGKIQSSDGAWWELVAERAAIDARQLGVVADGATDNATTGQNAIDVAVALTCDLIWPGGTVYSSTALTLPHTDTYFQYETGLKMSGSPRGTIFTRSDTGASAFIRSATVGLSVAAGTGVTSSEGGFYTNNTASAIVLTGTDGATLVSDGLTANTSGAAAEAFFAVYGSHYALEHMQFQDCKRAIYYGQDPDQIGVENSSNSFSRFVDLDVGNSSIGITFRAGNGTHYNGIRDCHVYQCQIGFDLGHTDASIGDSDNVNRSLWDNNRAARCHVGYWIRKGSTNTLIACHTEGCGAAPTNNRYSAPTGLPDSQSTWSFINAGNKNTFISCIDEGGDFIIHSSDAEAQYIGCRLGVSTANNPKTVFTSTPLLYLDGTTVWLNNGEVANLANTNTNVWGSDYVAGRTFVNKPRQIDEVQQLLTRTGASGGWTKLFDLGAVASSGTANFTIWPEVSSGATANGSAAAAFEVQVIGNSQTDTLVHHTTFRILAFRNSSRTLSRYVVLNSTGGVATGANAGSTGEAFTPALSVSTKDLVCTLTAPDRTFDGVTVFVRATYDRN